MAVVVLHYVFQCCSLSTLVVGLCGVWTVLCLFRSWHYLDCTLLYWSSPPSMCSPLIIVRRNDRKFHCCVLWAGNVLRSESDVFLPSTDIVTNNYKFTDLLHQLGDMQRGLQSPCVQSELSITIHFEAHDALPCCWRSPGNPFYSQQLQCDWNLK